MTSTIKMLPKNSQHRATMDFAMLKIREYFQQTIETETGDYFEYKPARIMLHRLACKCRSNRRDAIYRVSINSVSSMRLFQVENRMMKKQWIIISIQDAINGVSTKVT